MLNKITKNFSIYEFKKNNIDLRVPILLQDLREKFNSPITIKNIFENKVTYKVKNIKDTIFTVEIYNKYPVYGKKFINKPFSLKAFEELYPSNLKSAILALFQLGYKEGKNNNSIFGEYFNFNNQPWCVMFLAWLWIKGNIVKKKWKGFASTSMTYNILPYKCDLENSVTGDGIFYKKGHTGIIIYNDKENKYIYTVEGNLSNSVQLRKRSYEKFAGKNELYGCGNWRRYDLNINPIDLEKMNLLNQIGGDTWI